MSLLSGPLNYYRPWSHMMDKRCNLPLAPVSSHRLRWLVLFQMVSQLGIQMDYLQPAYDVCHVMQQYDLTMPRFLPKYDQPKYPRARHHEIRNLGILIRVPWSQLRQWNTLVHPWLLVPKSSNLFSRFVTDCSILTKQAYPTLEQVGSIHSFLHSLSSHDQSAHLDVHLEYDFVSFFYQLPLGQDVQPLFQVLLQIHETWQRWMLTVLPQGWRPSSGVAQTVSVAICQCLEVECHQQGFLVVARPWIDNIILRVSHLHRDQAESTLMSILTRLNLEAKFEGQDAPFLNIDCDWLTQTFRLTQKWLDMASGTVIKALQKQTLSLRLVWKLIGLTGYYVYTTTRLLSLMRRTYAFQSTVSQLLPEWERPVQIPNPVREELMAVVESMRDPFVHFPIWHPPTLPAVASMGVLVCDASAQGYGFHYLYQGIRTRASRTWSNATRPPRLPTGGHDQFAHEVAGLGLSLREILQHHPTNVPLLVVVDVQGIPRIVQKQYTTHPGMMDLMMDITDLTYHVTWGPGGDLMPADGESREGRYRTATRPISDSEDAQTFLDYIEDAIIYGQAKGYFTL